MGRERGPYASRSFATDRRSWALLLLLVAAAWGGSHLWLHRPTPSAPRRIAGPADDGRFVALAWDRVVGATDGRHVDAARIREQLQALADGGFQPVGLAEVAAFYRDGTALPASPVLVTFDEGYLSTYETVDPLLHAMGWRAVMFVLPERLEHPDVAFLYRDRLERMARSGRWEIAANVEAKVVAGDGTASAEAAARAIADGGAGTPVLAAAWRGRGPDRATGAARSSPPLCFVDDALGANAPWSDPRRLNRLRVDPGWSGKEVVTRIREALAPPAPAAGGVARAAAWVGASSAVRKDGDRIVLEAAPRADLWLPATGWVDEWVLEAEIRAESCEFWLSQPSPFPEVEWRLGGNGATVLLERRSPGKPADVAARIDSRGSPGTPHRLRLIRRGPGVWIEWDGVPLAGRPVHLDARWRGKLDLVALKTGPRGRIVLSGLTLREFPIRTRRVAGKPSLDEVQALVREAPQIGTISPPWLRVSARGIEDLLVDRDLLSLLSRRYAWDVLPRVDVAGLPRPETGPAGWPASLVARAIREGWSGIDLVPDGSDSRDRLGAEILPALERDMRRAGLRLLVAGEPPAAGSALIAGAKR
jgi:hypothetical protein